MVPLLSVTVTVKVNGEPAVDVGVPLSTPLADSVNQEGRLEDVNVYPDPEPPDAVSCVS